MKIFLTNRSIDNYNTSVGYRFDVCVINNPIITGQTFKHSLIERKRKQVINSVWFDTESKIIHEKKELKTVLEVKFSVENIFVQNITDHGRWLILQCLIVRDKRGIIWLCHGQKNRREIR